MEFSMSNNCYNRCEKSVIIGHNRSSNPDGAAKRGWVGPIGQDRRLGFGHLPNFSGVGETSKGSGVFNRIKDSRPLIIFRDPL